MGVSGISKIWLYSCTICSPLLLSYSARVAGSPPQIFWVGPTGIYVSSKPSLPWYLSMYVGLDRLCVGSLCKLQSGNDVTGLSIMMARITSPGAETKYLVCYSAI